MNVLLVTENDKDAWLVGYELAKRMPGLRVEVEREIQHAGARLASAGGFDAMLLDVELNEGDPNGLVRALRAEKNPIVIIGLVGDADIGSGKKLVASGADDFVMRGAGFIESLTAVLRRASGFRYPAQTEACTPKALYSIRVAEARSPSTSAAGGATLSFIRNNERERTADGGPVQEPEPALHSSANGPLGVERWPEGTEEEWLRLQEALQTAQTTLDEQSKRFRSERATLQTEWEQFRNQYDAAGKQKKVEEGSSAGQEQELRLREAEQERIRLQEVLRGLENKLLGKTEELRREREQWDLWRQEFKQKLLDIENRRASLERAALEEKQRHAAERAEWRSVQHELERRIASLEEKLRSASSTMKS
jgi:DNA-binding response OmpR family regulator